MGDAGDNKRVRRLVSLCQINKIALWDTSRANNGWAILDRPIANKGRVAENPQNQIFRNSRPPIFGFSLRGD